MDNATRRQLLMRHQQSGFPGSIMDVFAAAKQGIDLIGQFEQQQNIQVAQTPQQQQQGLRPAQQAGNISQSMIFPNVPPNTPFNTVGMKAPINIEKYDEQGHLVKSYENVPPGVQSLPTGPQRGTVIETPANMQAGGPVKEQVGPRVPMQDTPIKSTASRNLDGDSTYNVRGWLAAGAPGGIDPGDGEFHGASVGNNGMWLKSKDHSTAWKEHLHSQLSLNPFFKKNMSVVNPEGYFGENQLQYVPKKMQSGGPRKFQNAGALEFGQTGPDFETYGPALRIDGETYQASRETGATRVPLFEDRTQRPILLGAAEVYNEPISGVPDGYTPETQALADEGAKGVADLRNKAAGIGLAAVGDYFSTAQRYGVSAPLSLAMGKTPNLSATPLLDRAMGMESPNAFPSEILGVQNPYGAAAIDMVTDPSAALGLGLLGKSAVQQGSRAASRLSLGNRFKTGLSNPATRKTYSGADIAKGLEANAKKYGVNVDARGIARRTTRTRPGTAAFNKPKASQAFGDALVDAPRVQRETDAALREAYLPGQPGRERIMANFDELMSGPLATDKQVDDYFRQHVSGRLARFTRQYGPDITAPGSQTQRQFVRDTYEGGLDYNLKETPDLYLSYKGREPSAKGAYYPDVHEIENSTQAVGFGMNQRGRGLGHAENALDDLRTLQTHEGTHGLFPTRDASMIERKVSDQLQGGTTIHDYTEPSTTVPGSYNQYLRSPTEVEARVAEMRLKMNRGINRSGNFNLQNREVIDNLLSRVESDKAFAKDFAKDAGVTLPGNRNRLRDITSSQGPLFDYGVGRVFNSKFVPKFRGFGSNVKGMLGLGPTGYQRQATEYLNLAKYARKRGGPRRK